MTPEEIQNKISSQDDKVPCLHCPLMVVRSDMPRVGVCKICYAKAIKEGRLDEFKNYQTWQEFLGYKVTS